MVVEREMEAAEVILVVRHLEDQGFVVAVCGLEPLVLQLTLPDGIETPKGRY